MKKKILVLSIVIILLTTAVVGGSLAWFTDTDEVKNTFTVGRVDIKQLESFTQNSTLMPIVHNDTPQLTDDTNYVPKEVKVENRGNTPAYIRTHIAVPTALVGVLELDLNVGDGSKWAFAFSNQTTIGGKAYTVYSYTYSEALEGTDNWLLAKETELLLNGAYIGEKIDLNVYPETATDPSQATAAYFVKADGTEVTGFNVITDMLNVYVATQGVQAHGFASAKAAFADAFQDKIPEFTA